MSATIEDELKRLKDEQAKLAAKEEQLRVDLEKQAKREAQLEKLFTQSGYATPRELVDALMVKYNLRATRRPRTSTGPGRQRRKRTKVTPDLVKMIKSEVKSGKSMNQVSKEQQISYAVISNIVKGAYDKKK